jgi:hypothetical protein
MRAERVSTSKALQVECPTCGATAKHRCRYTKGPQKGQIATTSHKARNDIVRGGTRIADVLNDARPVHPKVNTQYHNIVQIGDIVIQIPIGTRISYQING